ncbi:MAG: hypothetical protein LRZ84_00175 [Desertifilum sp.]|nr:hypothetical protein [Desertifilum sp.]
MFKIELALLHFILGSSTVEYIGANRKTTVVFAVITLFSGRGWGEEGNWELGVGEEEIVKLGHY